MSYDYALVHLKYTIPPATVLTAIYWPLYTRADAYKILLLISISVVCTIPWDSYLIRHGVWTYPFGVLGPTLFSIPVEEVFFFVIQTYTTSLLYHICTKSTLHPIYLATGERVFYLQAYRRVGIALLLACMLLGVLEVWKNGQGLYAGFILTWSCTFIIMLWSLAYRLIISLPLSNTLLPIALQTVYLWLVDTLALRRGTWTISAQYKSSLYLWDNLEIEEALFFIVTNVLIVFGLITCDKVLAVCHSTLSFHDMDISACTFPPPTLLFRALFASMDVYDTQRIDALREAVNRLSKKSRSFYLASAVFAGRLRIDLVFLYSFCRVADDLVDSAASPTEARGWIKKISELLDACYPTTKDAVVGQIDFKSSPRAQHIEDSISVFPPSIQSAFRYIRTDIIPRNTFDELLAGFEVDLLFNDKHKQLLGKSNPLVESIQWPMETEKDLYDYGSRVAGAPAMMILELAFYHLGYSSASSLACKQSILDAGQSMGVALQYVNIARDVFVDARMGRVYIPTTWLKEHNLVPEHIILCCSDSMGSQVSSCKFRDVGEEISTGEVHRAVRSFRLKLLQRADLIYFSARDAMDMIPDRGVRKAMKVAVESYMEIGRVLRQRLVHELELEQSGKSQEVVGGQDILVGQSVESFDSERKATVPAWRRISVAWWTMLRG